MDAHRQRWHDRHAFHVAHGKLDVLTLLCFQRLLVSLCTLVVWSWQDNLFRHKDNIYKYYLRMHALSYAMTQARSELSQAAEAGSSKGEAKAGPVQPNFTLPTWEDINSCLEKVCHFL